MHMVKSLTQRQWSRLIYIVIKHSTLTANGTASLSFLGCVRFGSIRNKNNWNKASKRLFGSYSHSGIPRFPFRLFCSPEQNSRNIFRNIFLFLNIPNERALNAPNEDNCSRARKKTETFILYLNLIAPKTCWYVDLSTCNPVTNLTSTFNPSLVFIVSLQKLLSRPEKYILLHSKMFRESQYLAQNETFEEFALSWRSQSGTFA